MKQEDAKKLKPGEHIITIGTKEPIECIIDTVSDYGCVNVHDLDNYGSYYRTFDEIFPVLNYSGLTIKEMFYQQRKQEWIDFFTIPYGCWAIGGEILGEIILVKLTDDFCCGNGRYTVLSKNRKNGLWYDEFGEEIPVSAIEKFTIIKG